MHRISTSASERRLSRAGIRTVHYVSPSVWAWREKRAQKIGRSADLVLCLFPMEPPIYARYGVAARFVGHPLASAFAMHPDQQAGARRTLDIADEALVLALLPGSRLGEIARLGSDFLDAAGLLAAQLPNLVILAPMANARCRTAFEQMTATTREKSGVALQIRLLDGQAHEAMIAADAVLLASGTAALEAMLAKRPMLVAYRVAPWTYRIVKALGLLRTTVYSLPNILAGRTVVPELMQDDCTPAALAQTLAPLLRARALPAETLLEFERIHASLRGDATHAAAAAIAELLAVEPATPTAT